MPLSAAQISHRLFALPTQKSSRRVLFTLTDLLAIHHTRFTSRPPSKSSLTVPGLKFIHQWMDAKGRPAFSLEERVWCAESRFPPRTTFVKILARIVRPKLWFSRLLWLESNTRFACLSSQTKSLGIYILCSLTDPKM
jgi:hypothetical protein